MKLAYTAYTALLIASSFGALAQVDPTDATVEVIDDIVLTEGLSVDPDSWVLDRSEKWDVDSSDAGLSTNFEAKIIKVTINGENNTAITLSCQTIIDDGKTGKSQLNVAIDMDKSVDTARSRMKIRHISGRLTVGEKAKAERWIWNPETMRIVPHNREVARRLFNAGVRGDRVQLKALGENKIDIQLPEMNNHFRTFAKACPALQKKKK